MVLVCSILFNNLLLRFQRRINTAAVLTMMIATTHTVHKFFVQFFPFYFRPLSFFFCIFVFQFTIFYFIVLHFRILWLVNLFCSICTCMDNYSACIFRFFFLLFLRLTNYLCKSAINFRLNIKRAVYAHLMCLDYTTLIFLIKLNPKKRTRKKTQY